MWTIEFWEWLLVPLLLFVCSAWGVSYVLRQQAASRRRFSERSPAPVSEHWSESSLPLANHHHHVRP